jgi:hypothetical protein
VCNWGRRDGRRRGGTRPRAKRARYVRSGFGEAYDLVLLSVESFGRLGKPTMGLLNAVANMAASSVAGSGGGGSAFCKSECLTSALRRLSVALCRNNVRMYEDSLFTLARASGPAFRPGLLVPVTERACRLLMLSWRVCGCAVWNLVLPSALLTAAIAALCKQASKPCLGARVAAHCGFVSFLAPC